MSENVDVWLAGTSPDFNNVIDLPDTGRWESIEIPFTTSESIHLSFEDWVTSGGVAGDAYFDNIRLEVLDTPTDILFAENFESDLSRWTGKGRGPTSGIIVPDPLQGDRALSFTDFGSGGDIFTLESFISPSAVYRLSFDYLGLAGPGSVAGDIGGFVGYGDTLSENADVWLAGTSRNSINLAPNFLDLPDTGRWESIKIPFTTSESIHLTFEDFVSSRGVAGDAYFDNVRLETF